MSAEAVPSGVQEAAAPAHWWQRWSAAAGAVAVLASVLPPLEALAQRYVLAETIQFTVFAIVAPILITLGAPWRWLRLSRSGAPAGPLDWLAAARRHHRSFLRAGLVLLAFMTVSFAWWLPPTVNALATHPALNVLRMATLLVTGTALWLELLPSPPLAPRLPRPQRAAISALAMWFVWGIAYVIAFNNGPVFRTYGDAPGRALSLMADQQIAAGIMWAVAGFAFVPVVLTTMLGWLNDSEGSDEEFQRRFARDENQRAVVRGWGRPSVGRRSG